MGTEIIYSVISPPSLVLPLCPLLMYTIIFVFRLLRSRKNKEIRTHVKYNKNDNMYSNNKLKGQTFTGKLLKRSV